MPLQARVTLYNTLIPPLFDYMGDKTHDTIMLELQILENKVAKVLLGHPLRSSSTEALRSLDLNSLSARRFFHRCTAIHKCLIEETDFKFKFIKNHAYPFLELTGVNKLLSIKLRKTATGFQSI